MEIPKELDLGERRDRVISQVEAMCKELWKLNDPKVRAIFKKYGFSFPENIS